MKARLDFRVDSSGLRWMRMTLAGEGWTPGWSVPYANLASWGMVAYFAVPPAESEGLQADRDYRMSDTIALQSFDSFLDLLHQLIAAIKPSIQPSTSFSIVDEREYQ
jgi:hypothetical protein